MRSAGWCNTLTHPWRGPVSLVHRAVVGIGEGAWTPAILSFCSPVIWCSVDPSQHHHHDLHTLHTQTHTHTPFALTMPPFYTRVDDSSPNDIKQRTLHSLILQCQQRHVSGATNFNILNSFCGHFHIETIQFKTELPFLKYILHSCVIPIKLIRAGISLKFFPSREYFMIRTFNAILLFCRGPRSTVLL